MDSFCLLRSARKTKNTPWTEVTKEKSSEGKNRDESAGLYTSTSNRLRCTVCLKAHSQRADSLVAPVFGSTLVQTTQPSCRYSDYTDFVSFSPFSYSLL